jgi:hypothetical protein
MLIMLAYALQFGLWPSQQITWRRPDSGFEDLVGAILSGWLRSHQTGLTRAITGRLTVQDGDDGLFLWEYGHEDVVEAGLFDVQFEAVYLDGRPTPGLSLQAQWLVEPSLFQGLAISDRPITSPVIRSVVALSDRWWVSLIHPSFSLHLLDLGLTWRIEHSLDRATWTEVLVIEAEQYERLDGVEVFGTAALVTAGRHYFRASARTREGAGPVSVVFEVAV